MSDHALTQAQWTATPRLTLVNGAVLQRKCDCGNHTTAGGECTSCYQKRLQRAPRNSSSAAAVPSIVHDVLHSAGRPLDPATRAFMEPRFGHDFSHVRVHTDARAAESARALNALAYTVGRDMVFGAGHYVPGTAEGQRLLAHELVHVVQQRVAAEGTILQAVGDTKLGDNSSGAEREAEVFADRVVRGGRVGKVASLSRPTMQLQESGGAVTGGAAGGGVSGSTAPAAGARHITTIHVDMNTPQNVSLDWSDGTTTPSIQCSTGQGRCCPQPCDPPKNYVDGSNCTPDGTFTVPAKYRRTGGLNYFVSFGTRQIGLHEYSPVDGTPLSHGCVRLHRADAVTVYNGTVPSVTTISVTGLAVPNCPRPSAPQCPEATGSLLDQGSGASESALAGAPMLGGASELDPPV